jgi:hypothetical protein
MPNLELSVSFVRGMTPGAVHGDAEQFGAVTAELEVIG